MKTTRTTRSRKDLAIAAKRQTHASAARERGSSQASRDAFERQREVLLRRMDSLQPAAKKNKGYKTALRLLGRSNMRAGLAARLALLEAAEFLIRVLELLPPA